MLTFEAVCRYRQRHRRLFLSVQFNVHLLENRFPLLFEPFALKQGPNEEFELINYQQADQGLFPLIKYAMNFVLYRFGLEVNPREREMLRDADDGV